MPSGISLYVYTILYDCSDQIHQSDQSDQSNYFIFISFTTSRGHVDQSDIGLNCGVTESYQRNSRVICCPHDDGEARLWQCYLHMQVPTMDIQIHIFILKCLNFIV